MLSLHYYTLLEGESKVKIFTFSSASETFCGHGV